MKKISPSVIFILGRPGSGKGTQAGLLAKKMGLDYVSSGRLLRKRKRKNDFTGRKLGKVIDEGGLCPTSVIFKLWLDELEKLKQKNNFKGFLTEGSPRKIFEAYLLEEVLDWYEWNKNVKVVLIEVSPKEAIRRLIGRERDDDTLSGIKKRLAWFETNVRPVINYYRKKGRLIRIDGEQSVEKVFKDILKKI